jgi:tRNA (guanine37-N1)-methyltransferase
MLKFNVITLFPQLIEPHLAELPFKKAIEKNLIQVNTHQLRDYSIDKHGTVDDRPYGGGIGMILRVEPIYDALRTVNLEHKHKAIILTPKGKTYTQQKAQEYSQLEQLILVCGRYEGIDERVSELDKVIPNLEIEEISIGNFVMSGGELPALTIMESITRLVPGVIEKEGAVQIESFTDAGDIEFPQYTRPEDFKGLKVPPVLLSGNHKEIDQWRKENRKSITL